MCHARSQAVVNSAVKKCATKHSTVVFTSVSSLVIREHAAPAIYLSKLSASVERRLMICSVDKRASRARSPADVLLTAHITNVTRHATKASVCHARKIHLVRFTVPVAMLLLRVFWEGSERPALSLCPSVTLYVRGSCPVLDTSASSSVTMVHA